MSQDEVQKMKFINIWIAVEVGFVDKEGNPTDYDELNWSEKIDYFELEPNDKVEKLADQIIGNVQPYVGYSSSREELEGELKNWIEEHGIYDPGPDDDESPEAAPIDNEPPPAAPVVNWEDELCECGDPREAHARGGYCDGCTCDEFRPVKKD